jgi:hypothetical protein
LQRVDARARSASSAAAVECSCSRDAISGTGATIRARSGDSRRKRSCANTERFRADCSRRTAAHII